MPGWWDGAEHHQLSSLGGIQELERYLSVELSLELLHFFELFCFYSFNKILQNKFLISILSAWFWAKVIQEVCAELAAFTRAGSQWCTSETAPWGFVSWDEVRELKLHGVCEPLCVNLCCQLTDFGRESSMGKVWLENSLCLWGNWNAVVVERGGWLPVWLCGSKGSCKDHKGDLLGERDMTTWEAERRSDDWARERFRTLLENLS